MKLLSSAFNHKSKIPDKYGYKFANVSPPLIIEDVPPNAKSLALIMDDPDALSAVGKVWVHWILWNIPPNTRYISENSIPENSIEGISDFGEIGYGGPAPPDKEHKYFFKLYALSNKLDNQTGSSKNDIEKSMKSLILDEVELIGKFSPL